MGVLVFVVFCVIGLAIYTFFFDRPEPAAVMGLVVSVILVPFISFAFFLVGADNGRSMELCDQAGGVYSVVTETCSTPSEIIELDKE